MRNLTSTFSFSMKYINNYNYNMSKSEARGLEPKKKKAHLHYAKIKAFGELLLKGEKTERTEEESPTFKIKEAWKKNVKNEKNHIIIFHFRFPTTLLSSSGNPGCDCVGL